MSVFTKSNSEKKALWTNWWIIARLHWRKAIKLMFIFYSIIDTVEFYYKNWSEIISVLKHRSNYTSMCVTDHLR